MYMLHESVCHSHEGEQFQLLFFYCLGEEEDKIMLMGLVIETTILYVLVMHILYMLLDLS